MVNLFGASGYIGSRYAEKFPVVIQPRDDLRPQLPRVLYMISTTHNYHLPGNPYIDIDTNLTHLMRVLENLRREPQAEFNFISSWFVYGAVSGPVNERAPCDPQGFYSITKRTAEQLMMAYCDLHNINWRILRLCNVIGGHDTKASQQKNVLHTVTRNLRAHEPVTLINNGDFLRDYLHRDDACDAIHAVISSGDINRIYNIGSGHSIRFQQAVQYLHEVTASRSVIISENRHDITDCVLDCGRLRNLGWQPHRTWQQCMDAVASEI
jgi:nucleoside-diphosphate-sugar epimerase